VPTIFKNAPGEVTMSRLPVIEVNGWSRRNRQLFETTVSATFAAPGPDAGNNGCMVNLDQ
jgi:hypothetical protein